MNYIQHAKESLHKASAEASRMMSAHLRSEARASNWPSHIVNNLAVNYHDGSFSVHAHEDHYDDVLNLEYGTPDRQPTAVIRKLNNRTNTAENFLVRRLGHHMGRRK